jgi:hypothetical protein
VLPSLAPSLAAVAATVAAEFRDRRRLVNEREMQLNKERRQAYETLSKLTKGMDFQNPQPVHEVLEAHAQVEILSGNPKLLEVADKLVRTWTGAWESARNAHEAGEPYYPHDTPGQRDQGPATRSPSRLPKQHQGGDRSERREGLRAALAALEHRPGQSDSPDASRGTRPRRSD